MTAVDRALERYPGMRERFGKVRDADLAREYGITRARIWQLRTALGIPKYKTKPAVYQETVRTKTFARLVLECERRGLDRAHIASHIDTDTKTVNYWCRGKNKRQPNLESLVAVADLAGREIVLRPEGIVIRNKGPISGSRSLLIRMPEGQKHDPR